MNKIEKIVKEMHDVIEANELNVMDVRNLIRRQIDHTIGGGKWEFYPTTVAELREVIGTFTWARVMSGFHGFELDKDTIKEFWNAMDAHNQISFICEVWEQMLMESFTENQWFKNEHKNYEKLFDIEDWLEEFKDVVVEIKNLN